MPNINETTVCELLGLVSRKMVYNKQMGPEFEPLGQLWTLWSDLTII